MWKEEVLNLLSGISDFLGVLTEMVEEQAEVVLVRALKNSSRKLLKSAFRFMRSKVVKTIPIYD
jgi:uncharacterized protein YjgD (DUF1641 family)